ncbi:MULTISPECIES: hypothetical protein [Streptomyces]|uniref:hypothetical protein n=1 Tax=Streptomyces TaxID=1883 RepID=UPI00342DEED0
MNDEGELVGHPIRMARTGWASEKSVKNAVDALHNDPKLREDFILKATEARQHMLDHNWGFTENRAGEMKSIIDYLGKLQ